MTTQFLPQDRALHRCPPRAAQRLAGAQVAAGTHTAIRDAFVKLSPEAVEAAFRAHSAALAAECDHLEDCIAVDGKALKGSFDAMADPRAAQVLSAVTH